MKKKLKMIVMILAAMLVLIPLTACGNGDADDTTPAQGTDTTDTVAEDAGGDQTEKDTYIEAVRRINATDIEVVYSKDYKGGDPRALKFTVTADGGDRMSYNLDYGYGGAIFFDNLLTLVLAEPIADGADVKLEYDGVVFDVPYEPYYQYECVADCGVTVVGSRALIKGDETVKRAADMVDMLLSESPEIAEQMVKSGAKLAVFGKGEHAYYIPEHRGGYDEAMLYVEGFGGITCSITESNVWHWHAGNSDSPDSSYYTAYVNESILVHEFAHGIKIAGIDMMADQSLANEYQMVYRHAVASGLWPDSYAISNSDEFFATISAIWFNVMNESYGDDTWDGVRGPINTRKELYNYDIVTYNFFAKIYPYTDLDGAWTPVPDTVTVSGLGTEDAPDYGDVEHTLAYPEAFGFVGIDFSSTYKFLYRDAEYIIDTAASGTGIGLWWDYMADYPDSAGAMTYNFELVPGTEPETVDHVTTYTVYIKGVRDGYLYQSDDYILSAAALSEIPETPTAFELAVDETGLATIGCDGRVLVVDGDPDNGTLVKLVEDKGSKFYIVDVSGEGGNVLFVHNGTVNGSENGAILVEGATAAISAPETLDGKTFVRWEASAGTLADENSAETEFTMPAGDAVLWAVYE